MSRIQLLFFFISTLISNENLFVVTSASAFDTREYSDHTALLELMSKIVDGSGGAFSSWNKSLPFCQWEGVKCGRRHRRVTYLNLTSKSLAGQLSPSVGNLSFLRVLVLNNNTLNGSIPTEIGHLFRLETLDLSTNSFEGTVPAALSNCTNLKSLWLDTNELVGTILQQVTSLSKLNLLTIHKNHFSGGIPLSIGNLTSLERISATTNHLGGNIPYTIGQLKNLNTIAFGFNQLRGTIPPSLYNLSLLSIIDLDSNSLTGGLPHNIGLKLPKLQIFYIDFNKFTGLLPVSFSNCSELTFFNIGSNSFHGRIAINFGMMPKLLEISSYENNFGSGEHDEMNFIASSTNCSNLQRLSFDDNQLKGKLPSCVGNLSAQLSVFDFSRNSIYGSIPPSMMNLVNLEILILSENQLTGTIPSNLGNLVNLEILWLSYNQLIGTIPSNLGNLQKLESLYMSDNFLTGKIPESVGNLSLLEKLTLRNNRLEGTIPTTFRTCTSLNFLEIQLNSLGGSIPGELLGISSLISLNLSYNHLYGLLPQEIGKLHNLGTLDLSENELAGEIPTSLGDCSSIEYLQLEGNVFHGLIPSSFSSLRGIQYLDLSRNNFSGKIPRFLEKFSLNYLNVSFNNFEGELPTNGVFANATAISVTGNNRLCGGLSEFQLPKCINKEVKNDRKMSLVIIIVIPVVSLLAGLALVSYWLLATHRKRSKTQQPGLVMKQSFLNYSYETLLKATDGFSSESLIGMGSFSRVYRGVLEEDGETVAVKVLNLELRGASKSFMAECEAWRNIRHRNLVKIITACSSIDFQGNDFKALVYEFMENGSLETWLHSSSGTQTRESELHRLSLSQRIHIATNVAHAIDYLHHRCEIPIIHCDLKPSNILLDNDMVAHVGDFGLARFFLPDVSSIGQSSSIGLRGTIGYAPPEYGLGSEMSTDGDVYSFGIILLEMMTGKRPTDNMFTNGLNIHHYAKMGLPDYITDIVDPVFVEEERNETQNPTFAKQRLECMVSVIKVAIACSVDSPQDRMNISEVVDQLQRIANIILQ